MVHTVFKRAWYAKTECESTVKDECYREINLFGSAPKEKLLWTSINPRELSYTKMSKMIHLENFADMFNLSGDA